MGYAIFVLLNLPVISACRAWVLSILWSWFLVPLGLPEIGIAHAFGLALIAAMLTHQVSRASEEKKKSVREEALGQLATAYSAVFLTLGLGALANYWMP